MIFEKQFETEKGDITFSLFDSFGAFGNFALPINFHWSSLCGMYNFQITILCISFHLEIWRHGFNEKTKIKKI
jgi:hypothetical protein